MKLIITFLLCTFLLISHLTATFNASDWIDITKIHISKKSPTQQQVIFVNSFTEVGPIANTWHIVDMSNDLPEEAKAVNLVGILIITHGLNSETADLELFFRAYGETDYYLYTGQVIEASIYNGQRSTMSVWIPLSSDKKFEFYWTRTNAGQYPSWSAYGINLSLNAWAE